MKTNLHQVVLKSYGNKIRIRACGCLLVNNELLLVKHDGIGSKGYFWNVPGGEVEKGENLTTAVEREFLEETGLKVEAGGLLYVNEFIEPPLHAVEYYFEVKFLSGNAVLGQDPGGVEVLSDLRWFGFEEFDNMPKEVKPEFLVKHLNFG